MMETTVQIAAAAITAIAALLTAVATGRMSVAARKQLSLAHGPFVVAGMDRIGTGLDGDGFLTLQVANRGDRPAYDVRLYTKETLPSEGIFADKFTIENPYVIGCLLPGQRLDFQVGTVFVTRGGTKVKPEPFRASIEMAYSAEPDGQDERLQKSILDSHPFASHQY